jgi:carbonic anhydrase
MEAAWLEVKSPEDLFPKYRNTPIEKLFAYQNFQAPLPEVQRAELLISMCMDNRKQLRLPENFAFILRSGGGNLRHNEFKVSYAIAVGGVRALALIAHDECGMVGLMNRKQEFIAGLAEHGGWDPKAAEEHFLSFAPMFEIGNEIDFVLSEAQRLRLRYPKLLVAPLMYRIETGQLGQLRE